ncbi:MAG: hypothetical protein QM654_07915, partial [Dysgonamonadaceae bacterium]
YKVMAIFCLQYVRHRMVTFQIVFKRLTFAFKKRDMFRLNEGNRYVVCPVGVDLRKGIDSLCGLIQLITCQWNAVVCFSPLLIVRSICSLFSHWKSVHERTAFPSYCFLVPESRA